MKRICFVLTAVLALSCAQGVAQTSGIWLSRAEIAALPTSGTAWTNLKAAADGSCGSVDLANQDQSNNVCILAKALVFARTGQSSYRTDTLAALQSIVNMGTYNGRALALGRELGAYVIAADLVDLKNYNPSLDTQFRAKVKSLLTAYTSSGPSSLIDCHEDRPNNWGTHCGGARVAVDAYLGDQQDLSRAAQVFKGWLGDRAAYTGFTYGDLSWQCNPSAPVGINPAGCMKDGHSIDGVLPDDQRRAGGFTWPPPKENYVYEALQGALMQAVILDRAGYDAFEWEDRALLRAFRWMHNQANFPATGDDSWAPFLVNYYYGTSFPVSVGTTPGKNMGWTDWTHAGGYTPPPTNPTPVDTVAPAVSNVTASVVGETSATIMWTTNEASTGAIDYGATSSYGSVRTCNTTLSTSHSGTVTGLTPGTTYHYRVRSADAAGNVGSCVDRTFTTTGTAPTTQRPIASFSGSPVSGQAPLTVSFTDTSSGSPTSWRWTFGDGGLSTLRNPSHIYNAAGQYTVSLTATNAAGSNVATRTNYITVSAPTAGTGGLSGSITLGETRFGGSSGSNRVSTSTSVTAVAGHLYLAAVSTKSRAAVAGISGLGLSWTRVRAQDAGRNSTNIELWMARGTPSGSGVVTATLAAVPINAVISVSRYAGASSIGNIVSGNTNGVNGAISGGVDSRAYSFSLPAASTGSIVVGVAAIRNRTHTPGVGYTERLEVRQGSSGDVAAIAVQDKAAASANVVNGLLSSTTDWAVIGVELRR